eukprot:TRINITY_DN5696_c0_g1_i1.p1 TRINITY_DN5696_c0_g1~~TRINITY_DN5696_c0_g1_i1.p1  ORF type:complete len:686 (-),score=174.05 TRINITY_DN5696_c0_g1_i1:894-2951(-)
MNENAFFYKDNSGFSPQKASYAHVEVLHRPRGGGGKWIPIEEEEKIRVSSVTGKIFRLLIRSNPLPPTDINITAIDSYDDSVQSVDGNGMEIRFCKVLPKGDGDEVNTTQVDFKLYVHGMTLYLNVEGNIGGAHFSSKSINFTTHNSGKSKSKRKRKSAETKEPNSKKMKVQPDNIVIGDVMFQKYYVDTANRIENYPQRLPEKNGNNPPEYYHQPDVHNYYPTPEYLLQNGGNEMQNSPPTTNLGQPSPEFSNPIVSSTKSYMGKPSPENFATTPPEMYPSPENYAKNRTPESYNSPEYGYVGQPSPDSDFTPSPEYEVSSNQNYHTPENYVYQTPPEAFNTITNGYQDVPVGNNFGVMYQQPSPEGNFVPSPEYMNPRAFPGQERVNNPSSRFGPFDNVIPKASPNNPQGLPKITLENNLDVIGVVKARGFYQYSDVRLKTNIEDLADAMEIINSLSGKRYEWIDGEDIPETITPGEKCIGLLAQEVHAVAPELVRIDPDSGFMSVCYAELVPVLISAFNQFVEDDFEDKEYITDEIEELKIGIDALVEIAEENDQDIKNMKDELENIREKVEIITGKLEKHGSSSSSSKDTEIVVDEKQNNNRNGFMFTLQLNPKKLPLLFIILFLTVALAIVILASAGYFSRESGNDGDSINIVENPSFEIVGYIWEIVDSSNSSGDRRRK